MGRSRWRILALGTVIGALMAALYHFWPLSIEEREVEFVADGLRLAGTLSMPPGPGPHPALVMISGTQPDTRDAMVGDFPLFRAIAAGLVEQGIAVLRYDDRGTGRSEGLHPWQYSIEALSADAVAALRLLREEERIDPRRVGLLGHSLGGIIALRTWSRGADPAFLILMASYSTTGEELLLDYRRRLASAEGAEPEAAVERERRLIAAARRGATPAELELLYRRPQDGAPGRPLSGYDAYLLEYAATPLFRDFIDYDPMPELRRIDRPVLALFGAEDRVVPPALHRPPTAAALRADGEGNHVEVLPGGSHNLLLMDAKGVRLVDGIARRIAVWINGLPADTRDSAGL